MKCVLSGKVCKITWGYITQPGNCVKNREEMRRGLGGRLGGGGGGGGMGEGTVGGSDVRDIWSEQGGLAGI